MPTLLTTGDQVIIVTNEFHPLQLDIIDIDMRREQAGGLVVVYWLSDGKAYARSELFASMGEARQYCEACFKTLLARYEQA